ncbi:MAG: rod shape-determining protein [Hyphomonadaceae bacterium]|nr:rod shape-determining protein [Hyphomonadaceae bacterium]
MSSWAPVDAASDGWAIGIDFGTAFSKIAATNNGGGGAGREIMPLHIGAAAKGRRSLIVPSALFLDRDRIFFGPSAISTLVASGDEKRQALQSFKTILGAEDFERAIDLMPLRSVDPSGTFKMGELIVLYLAYLLELMRQSAPSRLGPLFGPSSRVRLRYSRPGWIPRRATQAHHVMEQLFGLAADVRADVEGQLLAPDGLPFHKAKDALARGSQGRLPNLDGGVYEASAVAACHYVDPAVPNYLMVVDIGAGTADFAGFARDPRDQSVRVLPSARVTIDVAGDSFDRALMRVILRKAKGLKRSDEQHALWRNLLANIRDLKESLFEHRRVEIRFRNHVIQCTAREFIASQEYRDAARELAEVYNYSVARMAKAVKAEKGKHIGIVLAGGGAFLPCTVEMAQKTKKVDRTVSFELLPTTPAWTSDLSSEREFEQLFSQMCVAFGTAIAGQGLIQNVLPSWLENPAASVS